MNLYEFLQKATIEDLDLPVHILQKLKDQNTTEFQKIYSAIQAFRAFGKCSIKGLTDPEIEILNQCVTNLLIANALIKQIEQPTRETGVPSLSFTDPNHLSTQAKDKKQSTLSARQVPVEKKPLNDGRELVVKKYVPTPNSPSKPPSPLDVWENRLAPIIRRVELIGETPISKEELDEIARHFSNLFNNRSEQTVLNTIQKNYPATFLVFMAGQGIHGYNSGDFWTAYEQALHRSFDHTAFGRLFETLLQRFGKPRFLDLQERSMRYVSLILAHGGIPVYCLKDYFSNIVLNCVVRPQFNALDGEELVEEVLKHPSFTFNTDKPVIYFLEYGGRTAANLLDRSKKMLLAWQQNQTLLSAEEVGLPTHITQYFAEWTQENAIQALERGSKTRLKRPQLSLDPWGLGVFLNLPSQPVSALNMSDLSWSVDTGDYHQDVKIRTQRKGDHYETREISLRLNEISEMIQVKFSQSDNEFVWKISGYSPDHLILSFDPVTGRELTHILAQETWLLYPQTLNLSILDGEGNLLEVLPNLPGDWSRFKLESWDLSEAKRLGLIQQNEVFHEIFVRSHEKVAQPSLDGGKCVPTDLNESPLPVYAGIPPMLRIPVGHSEDMQGELSRWQIRLENIGISDPEISIQKSIGELPETVCTIIDNIALIRLEAPEFLTSRPIGAYQIDIKGPLGRDAILSMEILPECEVIGLKELYIPDRSHGPENVSFSIQTALLDSVDSLDGADGIKIKTNGSGLHNILVPADISSVGLLVRRETINHQFIQMPIYFRIKRLRWRLVGDYSLEENWIQKHSNYSVQQLVQEESPLLIVDLPGNDSQELSPQLNLLDIQGNILQQLNPADRSLKRANRFWRFDLSKIKNSLEINDSPIFRVDLVGIKNLEEENFRLPVLVFTREIMISQESNEVYSSAEQHHILLKWTENKQLRSRALILWSLFRPWQLPITEIIPDAACGEYEFAIPRKDHADGLYRMQMVVIDPWAPLPPPPLPPAVDVLGCFEVELSSPLERLNILEREIAANHQNKQLSNRIEISLIRQYLGQIEASQQDLEACCRDLQPATSREILTLRSIVNQTKFIKLIERFGNQIILPEVLNRFSSDLAAGEITLSELESILDMATDFTTWTVRSCEIIVQLEVPKPRLRALIQLIAKDISKGVTWTIDLLQQAKLSIEDAVELLYEEKPNALEQLRKREGDPVAGQLLELLGRYNSYSGLPVIRAGSWVQSNAGWGRIDNILDPSTRISVDSFLEGAGKYILSVTMHIIESYDLSGEKAVINMALGEITFPRATRIFICQECQEFVTTKIDIFKNHLIADHGNALPYPGERKNIVQLKFIKFNMNPQQKNREL